MFPKNKELQTWAVSGLFPLLFVLACAAAWGGQGSWPVYKGAWFSISYPPGFTVRPAQRSATSAGGYDSAFFRSPDGRVEFYIFSPQWSGEPREIELNPAIEVLVEEKRQEGKGKQVRWVTVRAKDRSYHRSWVDEITGLNTRTVFGISYRDQKSYQDYRQDYLRFKKSLRQFAD